MSPLTGSLPSISKITKVDSAKFNKNSVPGRHAVLFEILLKKYLVSLREFQ